MHAPTSGRVAAIEAHPVPHPSGQSDTCIVIDVDGDDEAAEPVLPDLQGLLSLLAREGAASEAAAVEAFERGLVILDSQLEEGNPLPAAMRVNYADAVRNAERQWVEQGVQAVPAFIFNGRAAVLGAQEAAQFQRALAKAA